MLLSKERILRGVGAPLFTIGGAFLMLMSMLGGPSFWYFPCFCVLAVLGIVWIWRPSLAAALSVGPLVSVVALLQYPVGAWASSRFWGRIVIAALTTAVVLTIVLIVVALRDYRRWPLPVALSLAFVGGAYATDRLFTNKVTIRSYQMYVAVNGHAPWGDVEPEWSDGSAPIVLYRRLGNGYCYYAFKSEELRQRLSPKNGQAVTVQYNIFRDFGKDRSYNVRSVDGLLLSDEHHTVKNFEGFGGHISGNGDASPSGVDNCR